MDRYTEEAMVKLRERFDDPETRKDICIPDLQRLCAEEYISTEEFRAASNTRKDLRLKGEDVVKETITKQDPRYKFYCPLDGFELSVEGTDVRCSAHGKLQGIVTEEMVDNFKVTVRYDKPVEFEPAEPPEMAAWYKYNNPDQHTSITAGELRLLFDKKFIDHAQFKAALAYWKSRRKEATYDHLDTLKDMYLSTNTGGPVVHPKHYNQYQGFEVIDVCEQLVGPDGKSGFNLGNAFKYIARAGWKNPEKHLEDLEKAVFYIQREIERVKKDQTPPVDAASTIKCKKCMEYLDAKLACPKGHGHLIDLGNGGGRWVDNILYPL